MLGRADGALKSSQACLGEIRKGLVRGGSHGGAACLSAVTPSFSGTSNARSRPDVAHAVGGPGRCRFEYLVGHKLGVMASAVASAISTGLLCVHANRVGSGCSILPRPKTRTCNAGAPMSS